MNQNTLLTSDIDSTSISLLPKDNTQSRYHFRLRLGFIPQRKKKFIMVDYSVHNGILQVGFKKINGDCFIGQHSAEKWFTGPIKVSHHVGEHVVTSIHEVHHHIFCRNCGIEHFTKSREFIGTADMFSGNRQIETEFDEECPTCGCIRTVDIHEKCG